MTKKDLLQILLDLAWDIDARKLEKHNINAKIKDIYRIEINSAMNKLEGLLDE